MHPDVTHNAGVPDLLTAEASGSFCPDAQCAVPGDVSEVFVGAQQGELVADAQLGQQSIDSPCLDTAFATEISQRRRCDVILTVRHEERKSRKTIHDLVARPGPRESLKELLQDESRRHNRLAGLQSALERSYLPDIGRAVATQQQRPDAGVYKECQRRDLSFL